MPRPCQKSAVAASIRTAQKIVLSSPCSFNFCQSVSSPHNEFFWFFLAASRENKSHSCRHLHPVAPCLLGPVHGAIGAMKQGVVILSAFERCNADTDR